MLANHRLPVESLRYLNIDYEKRICPHCHLEIGDEYHYLFKCPKFQVKRNKLPIYFTDKPSMFKYKELFNITDKNTLIRLCSFIKDILRSF